MALRPVKMVKLGLLGLREDEERVLTVLHDLRVAQIEPLDPAAMGELAPERGSENLRHVGDETLRFRGLLSALPHLGAPSPRRFDSLGEIFAAAATVPIDAEVGELKREDDRLLTEQKASNDLVDLLEHLSFYTDRLEYLHSASYLTFYGEAPADSLPNAFPPEADARLILGPSGETARFLVITRPAGADALSRTAQARGIRLVAVPALKRTPTEELVDLRERLATIARRRQEIAARLTAIAQEWYPTVAAIDEALEIENRKAEVLAKLGASRATFALESWVPSRDVERLKSIVASATDGRVYFYEVPTHEEPPTMMSNPRGVRRFEFFIRFYSLPQASEWDPTLVFAIVFPIFFGFMLGDWGYGLVILLISLWMITNFPGARFLPRAGRNFVKLIMGPKGMQQLAYALLPGCALAIGLGLFWDEFFGFHLLGALFHYAAPVDPLHKADVALLLLLAGFIGLGMVVLGFLFGALKEYYHHHPRAVLGKVGGILFAFGVAFFGLAVIHKQDSFTGNPLFAVYLALLVIGLLLLIFGEGIQTGMMSLIEVVSHILSYTRLVGILLASVILALVINTIGSGLVLGGTIVGIIAGLVILLIGQSFNVILGVFEPGIQGARLIFVEYFSKFYSGNGKPFRPFGAARTHTMSSIGPDGQVAMGPILRGPPT
jgi:V/A-type H+/Na+-transporting ATPase subunit I